MTLKEFLTDKTLTAVELSEEFGIIFNVYIEEAGHGLNVNTTSIPYGTQLTMREDFTLQDDILSVAGISIDTTITEML